MRRPSPLLLALPLLLVSCSHEQRPGSIAAHAPGGRPDAGALHNLQPPIAGRIMSGAGPDSPAAFDELSSLGVRTVISVDGGTPDVAAAAARGIRYIHIPVSYATITDRQRLEIARAVRDHPGLVYIHCHHGKHRGPAAAAVAAIALGLMKPEEGAAFMRAAGTSESYTGLWECIAAATQATAEELDAAPAEFPPVRKPGGVVAAMVEIDVASENLTRIRAAGWTTPADHPDLVPAAEAGRLADHLRFAAEDRAAVKEHGPAYLALLMESAAIASHLERGIVERAGSAELNARLDRLRSSCKDCHGEHRDR
jgi:protein tyrosine phosphatase (PTP) superfamily phosphohydrolase (DUF442 family)